LEYRKYMITGVVLPERNHVTIDPDLFFKIDRPDLGFHCEIHIHIQASQITAMVRSKDPIKRASDLRNLVQDAIQIELDIEGYRKGMAFTAQVNTMVDFETDEVVLMGGAIKELSESASERPEFVDVLDLFKSRDKYQEQLRVTLASFRLAIRNPGDAAFFCYRAIEALKQAFGTWAAFNAALNIDRSWSDDFRKKHADKQRHGAPSFMLHDERVEALFRVQKVIDRYVTFMRQGNAPLHASKFPILRK
jgi:hypothetical protein